jgi:hypothetical protein
MRYIFTAIIDDENNWRLFPLLELFKGIEAHHDALFQIKTGFGLWE